MPRYVGKTLDPESTRHRRQRRPRHRSYSDSEDSQAQRQDWDGTWNATHLSDGIYYTKFTPDEAGDWTFIFSCSNPKFAKAIVYHISYPVSFQFPKTGMNSGFPFRHKLV